MCEDSEDRQPSLHRVSWVAWIRMCRGIWYILYSTCLDLYFFFCKNHTWVDTQKFSDEYVTVTFWNSRYRYLEYWEKVTRYFPLLLVTFACMRPHVHYSLFGWKFQNYSEKMIFERANSVITLTDSNGARGGRDWTRTGHAHLRGRASLQLHSIIHILSNAVE